MHIYRKLLLKNGGILELCSLENYSAASADMNSSQFTCDDIIMDMGTAERATELFCRTQWAPCLKVSEPGG